jgi:hypothetical protein
MCCFPSNTNNSSGKSPEANKAWCCDDPLPLFTISIFNSGHYKSITLFLDHFYITPGVNAF